MVDKEAVTFSIPVSFVLQKTCNLGDNSSNLHTFQINVCLYQLTIGCELPVL